MILKKRGAAIAATTITVAMLAAACGGGGNVAEDATVTETATDVIEDGHTVGEDGTSTIDDAHRVGAMPDFEVGTHFRATEPITIDLLYRVHANYPVQDDWLIWDAFREGNNVTFNREDVLFADWGQRRNLLVASGDFPTLVPVVWGGEEGAWWAGGNLLPISDYFEYMPNFQHFVQAWGIEDELENFRQEDGKIYRIPGLRESPNIEQSFMVNVDLFEAAGVDVDSIHTYDDLTEALRQVQAHGDVDFAYSDRWNTQDAGPLGAAMQNVAPNFGTTGGWNREITNFDTATDEFVPRIATDGFRDMVAWFAQLRADGVMDPEITQTDEDAIAKFINRHSAMISTNGPQQEVVRAAAIDAGLPPINTRMIVLPDGPAGGNVIGSLTGPGIVLNSDIRENPNFLAILQFVDWLYFSEEGREFAMWGVEEGSDLANALGVATYTVDADGNRQYLGNITGGGRPADGVDNAEPIDATFGFQDGVWMQNWGGSNDLLQSTQSQETRDWVNAMLARKNILPVNPAAPLTEEEQEMLGDVTAATQSATESGIAQFILGTRPMTEWDSFVTEIRNLGADQITEAMNTALHRARG